VTRERRRWTRFYRVGGRCEREVTRMRSRGFKRTIFLRSEEESEKREGSESQLKINDVSNK
jgi:hypothetical protein